MAYTTINDPSAHHQSVAYTGAGNNSSVTFGGNSDLQLDWLWVKRRDSTDNSKVFDTSRGIGSGNEPYLTTISGEQEQTYAYLTSVDSDGFTWDTVDSSTGTSSNTYVAWGWKANGGTTANNTSGDIGTSVVQANTTAGFSIVLYTGNNTGGSTVGHGLGGVPEWIITKSRAAAKPWVIYHVGMGNTKSIKLNATDAAATDSSAWSNTTPSSTTFTLGNGDSNHTGTMLAYCFRSIQGYSKFGSYTGNGSTDGPFIYTGFKPAWLMVKGTSSGSREWFMFDSIRDTFNPFNSYVKAEANDAEADSTFGDFLSNGFKVRSDGASYNANGEQFIYMAFAEHPFVSSEGVPTTAR